MQKWHVFFSQETCSLQLITQGMVTDSEITLTLSKKNGWPESLVILSLNPFLFNTNSSILVFQSILLLLLFFFFFFFLLYRAALPAPTGSQARGRIGATAAGLHHSHSNAGSKLSATYTTAQDNAGSLTH